MFCNHCGAEIKDGVKFCDKCGGKVEIAQPKQENVEAKVEEKSIKESGQQSNEQSLTVSDSTNNKKNKMDPIDIVCFGIGFVFFVLTATGALGGLIPDLLAIVPFLVVIVRSLVKKKK